MQIGAGIVSRRLSKNGYFPQSLRQAKIIILEILPCIPMVIISVFLDLEKNISLSDNLLASCFVGFQVSFKRKMPANGVSVSRYGKMPLKFPFVRWKRPATSSACMTCMLYVVNCPHPEDFGRKASALISLTPHLCSSGL